MRLLSTDADQDSWPRRRNVRSEVEDGHRFSMDRWGTSRKSKAKSHTFMVTTGLFHQPELILKMLGLPTSLAISDFRARRPPSTEGETPDPYAIYPSKFANKETDKGCPPLPKLPGPSMLLTPLWLFSKPPGSVESSAAPPHGPPKGPPASPRTAAGRAMAETCVGSTLGRDRWIG